MPTGPDWRELLLAELDAKNIRAPRTSMAIMLHLTAHGLILAAARKRGMSIGAYARRAAIAFAVHDLEADWDEVMQDEAAVGERGGGAVRAKGRGRGFGPWRILALGEYEQ